MGREKTTNGEWAGDGSGSHHLRQTRPSGPWSYYPKTGVLPYDRDDGVSQIKTTTRSSTRRTVPRQEQQYDERTHLSFETKVLKETREKRRE